MINPDFDLCISAICAERPEWAAALARARVRQEALVSAPAWSVRLALLADVLGQLVLERGWTQAEVAELLALAVSDAGVSVDDAAVLLARQAVREYALLSLPPRRAADALLRLLHLAAPLQAASLWVWRPGSRLGPAAWVGDREPGRRAREVARRAVAGNEVPPSARALVRGFPVGVPAGRAGALVIHAYPSRGPVAVLIAQEVGAAFRSVLERQMLAEIVIDADGAAIRFGDRGLRRVGIDLHDGPLQQLARLLGDARLLRTQILERLPDAAMRDLVVGRVDDLTARVEAVNADLRALARSYAFPAMDVATFRTALDDALATFAARTGATVSLEVDGAIGSLLAATKLAVLRIVTEAIGNAHHHGAASTISVRVSVEDGTARVEIEDDGCGFDVESTLARAAAGGRLGVLGMIERARLLGGGVSVESKPGGPTTITAILPGWAPLEPGGRNRAGASSAPAP